MINLHSFIGKNVDLKVSGLSEIKGKLIDVGTDVFVLFNGKDYLYIPLAHVHSLYLNQEEMLTLENQEITPLETEFDTLSFRKVLLNAKGIFSEICVSNKTIHGYISNIMNDYFVFHSPTYQTLYVSMQHIKYLIPYQTNQVPYALDKAKFSALPSTLSLARSFDAQIKKMVGNIAIFDLYDDVRKIGQIRSIGNHMIELVTAREEITYVNPKHIKTVHLPN
ncbi:DUF2642 domain-containing protein [Metabacillus niabensis]|uniref:DUF2642 domain-containing protein n=1 Tax=Metabacillus TaxID=2675233 RepID=UPI0011A471E0